MGPDQHFWEHRYTSGQTGWDVGSVSFPLKNYIDQLRDKRIQILIPGCGNAWEAEYLMNKGFTHVTLVDIAENLTQALSKKFAGFIREERIKIIHSDFFELNGEFDLILEQTFFCAIDPSLRKKYTEKMFSLLKPGGKLTGVLFGIEMEGGPPFGGTREEYLEYFSPLFTVKVLGPCYDSIKPREGRELFMILEKTTDCHYR